MSLLRWMGVSPANAVNHHASNGAPTDGKPVTRSPADAKHFGFENFGNTCYANSVLQALYFCQPFRDLVVCSPDKSYPPPPSVSLLSPPAPAPSTSPSRHPPSSAKHKRPSSHDGRSGDEASVDPGPPIPNAPPSLFSALRSLFIHISMNPSDKGTVSPSAFIAKLKKENELFRSSMHQDAHEFLNYLLNKIVEDIEEDMKEPPRPNGSGEDLSKSIASLSSAAASSAAQSNSTSSSAARNATLVHNLFEGTLTSETRCLTCETVSSRDESFLDLSIDIEQNSSVTACLRQFSASEMLCQKNKFFCDSCCGLQEAEKRMKIKKLPNVLALHLKRFKYQEDVQKYIKLAYRVAFPLELRLFNTVDDAPNPDRLYELFSIVVHIGGGPHHGHYITIVKARGNWYLFDDDSVELIKESEIPKYFGDSPGGAGYVLFYQAVDLDPVSVGLPETAPAQRQQQTTPPVQTPSEPLPVPGASDAGDSISDSDVPVTPSVPSTGPESPLLAPRHPLKVDIPAPEPTLPVSAPVTAPSVSGGSSTGGFFTLGRSLKHSASMRAGDKSLSPATIKPPNGFGDPAFGSPNGHANGYVTKPGSSSGEPSGSKGGWFSSRKASKEKRRETIQAPVPERKALAVDNHIPPRPHDDSTTWLGGSLSDQPYATNELRRPSAPGLLESPMLPPKDLFVKGDSSESPSASSILGESVNFPSSSSSSHAHHPPTPGTVNVHLPPPSPSPRLSSSPKQSVKDSKAAKKLAEAAEKKVREEQEAQLGLKAKRASRKLSLTAMPIGGSLRLGGFGKKDKDKDKEKEKEKLRTIPPQDSGAPKFSF